MSRANKKRKLDDSESIMSTKEIPPILGAPLNGTESTATKLSSGGSTSVISHTASSSMDTSSEGHQLKLDVTRQQNNLLVTGVEDANMLFDLHTGSLPTPINSNSDCVDLNNDSTTTTTTTVPTSSSAFATRPIIKRRTSFSANIYYDDGKEAPIAPETPATPWEVTLPPSTVTLGTSTSGADTIMSNYAGGASSSSIVDNVMRERKRSLSISSPRFNMSTKTTGKKKIDRSMSSAPFIPIEEKSGSSDDGAGKIPSSLQTKTNSRLDSDKNSVSSFVQDLFFDETSSEVDSTPRGRLMWTPEDESSGEGHPLHAHAMSTVPANYQTNAGGVLGGSNGVTSADFWTVQDDSGVSITDLMGQKKFKDWKCGARYDLKTVIGDGAYGCVAQAIDRVTKATVAIKRVILRNNHERKLILREVQILRQLNHSNIVKILDFIIARPNPNEIYIVTECMDMDLEELLRDTGQTIEEIHARKFVSQILLGLKHLKDCRILHRDIKPQNIFLRENCSLVLGDFGLARLLPKVHANILPKDTNDSTSKPPAAARKEEKGESMSLGSYPPLPAKRQLTAHVQTRWHRAPEVILSEGIYDMNADMWSVGCIIADILFMVEGTGRQVMFPGDSCFPYTPNGSRGFEGSKNQLNTICKVVGTPSLTILQKMMGGDNAKAKTVYQQLANHSPQDLTKRFTKSSASMLDLLQRCLSFDPASRITVEEALQHDCLKGTEGIESLVDDIDAYIASCKEVPITMNYDDTTVTGDELLELMRKEVEIFKSMNKVDVTNM